MSFSLSMKKKRYKPGFVLSALRFTVFGFGKPVWYLLKSLWKFVSWVFSTLFRFFSKKIEENKKENALRKQPHYSTPASFSAFEVVEGLSGEYSGFHERLLRESLIVLVFGKRGSGKSALGFRILENVHAQTQRSCFVMGVPQIVLPQWITPLERLEEATNGGVVLVDEGALAFAARESMSKKNVGLGKLLAVARHKDLTLLFITQNTSMIDKHVLSLADVLMVKKGSLLQQEMERPEIRKFYEKAENAFVKLSGDAHRYVYVIDSDFEGVVAVGLPGFWSSGLSKSRRSA
mgnify:CR=1 FL=1